MPDPILLARVIDIVRTEFPGAPDTLSASTQAEDVDGWDSVSHAMLVLSLEDALDVRLEFEKTLEAPDLGALTEYIQTAIRAVHTDP